MKKLFVILLVCSVIAIAIVGSLYFFTGTLVKTAVTHTAPGLMGVPVTLESIQIRPLKGAAEVRDLVIANPETFKSDHAFRMARFRVELDPKSLLGEVIHIRELTISGASVISDGLLADNHRQILDHLRSIMEPQERELERDTKPGKKLIIDQFVFEAAELIVVLNGEEITRVAFPEIRLQQIGSREAAVTGAEALLQIYSSIASETVQVIRFNRESIDKLVAAKLGQLGIQNLDDLRNPQKLIREATEQNPLLRSLLNRDKKED